MSDTPGMKAAHRSFKTKVNPGPRAHSPQTKGSSHVGGQHGMGHKAPSTTKGQGRRMASQSTRKGPGFPMGHKAKSTSHGRG